MRIVLLRKNPCFDNGSSTTTVFAISGSFRTMSRQPRRRCTVAYFADVTSSAASLTKLPSVLLAAASHGTVAGQVSLTF